MLTVVILTHNESEDLKRLIPKLGFADQVLVVDDESTDDSVKIAHSFGAKVIISRLNEDFAKQRNLALKQILNGWVLYVDADEIPSQELIDNVVKITSKPPREFDPMGYLIERIDVFRGKKLKYGEFNNKLFVRLGWYSAGRWLGAVHEEWKISNVSKINGELRHYSHSSYRQFYNQIKNFSLLRAKELHKANVGWNFWEQAFFPMGKFIQNFFIRSGFRDRLEGLITSVLMSVHSFKVRSDLWDLYGKNKNVIKKISRLLLVMTAIILPLGQINRTFIFEKPLYVFELLMFGYWLSNIDIIFLKSKELIRSKVWRSIIIFSLVMLVSSLGSIIMGQNPTAILHAFRWINLCGFFATWKLANDDVSVIGIQKYTALMFLVGGVLQYLFFPDMRWTFWFGFDDHYYRLVGTILDPNYFGLMIILIKIFVDQQLANKFKLPVDLGYWILLGLTFSRTSLLIALLMKIFEIKINKLSLVKSFFMIAVVLTILLGISKVGGEGVNFLRTYSIQSRINNISESLKIFYQNPIFGIGYNQYPNYVMAKNKFNLPYYPSAPDNAFVLILVTMGIVGMLAFLNMVATLIFYDSKLMRLSVIAVLLHSMANNSWFYPFVIYWMWLILISEKS